MQTDGADRPRRAKLHLVASSDGGAAPAPSATTLMHAFAAFAGEIDRLDALELRMRGCVQTDEAGTEQLLEAVHANRKLVESGGMVAVSRELLAAVMYLRDQPIDAVEKLDEWFDRAFKLAAQSRNQT